MSAERPASARRLGCTASRLHGVSNERTNERTKQINEPTTSRLLTSTAWIATPRHATPPLRAQGCVKDQLAKDVLVVEDAHDTPCATFDLSRSKIQDSGGNTLVEIKSDGTLIGNRGTRLGSIDGMRYALCTNVLTTYSQRTLYAARRATHGGYTTPRTSPYRTNPRTTQVERARRGQRERDAHGRAVSRAGGPWHMYRVRGGDLLRNRPCRASYDSVQSL